MKLLKFIKALLAIVFVALPLQVITFLIGVYREANGEETDIEGF